MAANALFLGPRALDAAVVSASSTEGDLPASHVQTMDPTEVWRATGCDAEWLAWDFGADVAVNAVIITAHNLSATAQLRLRLAATEADVTASPAVDSGLVSAWPASGMADEAEWPSWLSMVRVVNSTGYRYGRLDIVDPDNEAGFVEVGRGHAGSALVTTANIDLNPSFGLISPDAAARTAFGHAIGDRRGPAARVFTVGMSSLLQSEVTGAMLSLQRECGLGRDLAVVLAPDATTEFHVFAMQARFEGLAPMTAQPLWDGSQQIYQTSLTLSEVL